jgi:two-component system LytT family response regulator
MVKMFCPEVTIVGVAESVAKAVEVIRNTKPDIVLMDIELRPGKCFEIFPQLETLDFEVIFTTAFKDYAIEAIKFGALDYLLKPIDINELSLAITKASRKRKGREENTNLKQFLKDFRSPGFQRISLPTTDGIVYAVVDQIIHCEAKGPYTIIYLNDGNKYMTSKNLKEYETMLVDYHFFRIHNSHLINLAEVVKYKNADGGAVEMKDGSLLPVAQRRRDDFFDQMKNFTVNPDKTDVA